LFLKSYPEATPAPLILASTSAYRRTLLERLRLPFRCVAPGIDEGRGPGEAPLALAARLAGAKAQQVAAQHSGAWVIGSDQVAVLGEPHPDAEILGKPGTPARCAEQLRDASGRLVVFLTAVAVVRGGDAQAHTFVDTTRVQFRPLDAATIARYVELESPLDCAGGVKSEGLGVSLFEWVESRDPSGLIGLPLIRLAAVLREVGYRLP
jgi:septum formation protein